MNKENIPVITDREKLYDKCENMEQLFSKYYLPLLDKHYSKTYELQQENQELKKQLEYLRSGEYYNQLRFENEMLQQVVDTNGVPSEVYDYIDCTHRNTELLKENQKLKDRDLIIAAELTKLQDENKQLKEAVEDYKEDISNLFDIINKNCNELKCTSDEWLVIQKYQDKEVSE